MYERMGLVSKYELAIMPLTNFIIALCNHTANHCYLFLKLDKINELTQTKAYCTVCARGICYFDAKSMLVYMVYALIISGMYLILGQEGRLDVDAEVCTVADLCSAGCTGSWTLIMHEQI